MQPRPESLLSPDGHCDNGEGWACSGSIVGKLDLKPMIEIISVRMMILMSLIPKLQEQLHSVLLASVQQTPGASSSVSK